MKLFFSSQQMAHQPKQYMVNGRITDPLENPARAQTLIKALTDLGLSQEATGDAGLNPILAVHADHYVEFLQTAYDRFMQLPNHGPEVLPNVSAYQGADQNYAARPRPRPVGVLGQAGWYINGLSCAMMESTYVSAYASAQTAISAANALLSGEKAAFALCRPPGHHAYVDRAAGFCYFNNAAIIAQHLRQQHERVAIIDFDTHHGDGTQAIFYSRDDVFVGSTHTDPSNYYPTIVVMRMKPAPVAALVRTSIYRWRKAAVMMPSLMPIAGLRPQWPIMVLRRLLSQLDGMRTTKTHFPGLP